ncbi:unnamed protein product [Adineta ricciae]|nr:unnamed protein product [Adineta ricciae]
MASYRNTGALNSSNINNNNNSTRLHSSALNREPYDYSTTRYSQTQNYKTLTMPKTHYQNITTAAATPTRDLFSKENGTSYLTASSFDAETNSSVNEASKRLNNPNGKFSIQKIIRHGFSSWRTRKKPSSSSSSPPLHPQPPHPAPPPPKSASSSTSNGIYANTSSSPSSPPYLPTGRFTPYNDELAKNPPTTAARSISVDSITNRSSPPQKLATTTESTNHPTPRVNSANSVTVEFERPATVARVLVPTPWATSATATATTNTSTTTTAVNDLMYRATPVPIARALPVQFAELNRPPTSRSSPPASSSLSSSSSTAAAALATTTTSATTTAPPTASPLLSSAPPTTVRTTETNSSTTPSTSTISHAPKIPPPVAPKPDVNRLTPMRSNYLNNNNNSSSNPVATPPHPTPPPPPPSAAHSSTATITLSTPSYPLVSSPSTNNEQRRPVLPEKLAANQFKPISDTNNAAHSNATPTPTVRSAASSTISALQEKLQMRSSPVATTNSAPLSVTITTTNASTIATPTVNTASPFANSSSTPAATVIQTSKQIIIQDIDTTKYEEIPAKEPDLTRQPEKSALKKPNGLKRRVIPVLRENQRPSPRPSPKTKPVVFLTSPPSSSTANNDEHNSENERNENPDSAPEDDDDDDGNNETTKRFANVKRNDSLARFLKDRPLPNELFDKHILVKPVDERKNERDNIETKLERKLSLRPTSEELEARNILRAKTQAELIAEKEEKKRYLIRKLSFRPSIQELRERKIIRFCDYIEVSECDDVDRRADKPWTRLTPRDKQMIRKELNDYKSLEMEIHPESAKYTRFHPP